MTWIFNQKVQSFKQNLCNFWTFRRTMVLSSELLSLLALVLLQPALGRVQRVSHACRLWLFLRICLPASWEAIELKRCRQMNYWIHFLYFSIFQGHFSNFKMESSLTTVNIFSPLPFPFMAEHSFYIYDLVFHIPSECPLDCRHFLHSQ